MTTPLRFDPLAQPDAPAGTVGPIHLQDAALAAHRSQGDTSAVGRYGYSVAELTERLVYALPVQTTVYCPVESDRPGVGRAACGILATTLHLSSDGAQFRCGIHVGWDPDSSGSSPLRFVPVIPRL